MPDPSAIATVIGCLVAVIAARYAYLPYRSQKLEDERNRFIETRRAIAAERYPLTERAAALYGSEFTDLRLPGMLTGAHLIPDAPIPLSSVKVDFEAKPVWNSRHTSVAKRMLPRRANRLRFENYSAAVSALCPPTLWFDASCYALTDVRISDDQVTFTISTISYFQGVDFAESLAHELAGRRAAQTVRKLPLRKLITNPTQLGSWPSLAAVSSLVLRQGADEATFFLHERDSKNVALAGGQSHLAPSGVYQPTAADPETVFRDRHPILTLCRELAEEYLGVEEARGEEGAALSYDEDEPYASILEALLSDDSKCHVVGIGMDPLTLCPEILTVTVLPFYAFDSVFEELRTRDSEGRLVGARRAGGKLIGFRFTRDTIDHLHATRRLSPAARAALEAAWTHREMLL